MNSVEGRKIYEIVDSNGESITAPYQNIKSLNESLAIAKRFDPHYHEKYKVKVMTLVLEDVMDIQPPKVKEELPQDAE